MFGGETSRTLFQLSKIPARRNAVRACFEKCALHRASDRKGSELQMTVNSNDIDPVESQEWQEAIQDVIEKDGANRAHYLLDKAVQQARAAGANLPFSTTTGRHHLLRTGSFPTALRLCALP